MKKILLLRHAQSPSNRSMKDFDRPLNEEGKQQAYLMGRLAAVTENYPARVLSSPAARARQTTERFIDGLELNLPEPSWIKELYSGTVMDYVRSIQELPDELEVVTVVGHNPLVEQAVSEFCGSAGDVAIRMPVASLACIEHPARRWEMVLSGTSRLKWLITPGMAVKLVSADSGE